MSADLKAVKTAWRAELWRWVALAALMVISLDLLYKRQVFLAILG